MNEDDIIKTLLGMRDRWERTRYIESLKARYTHLFGSAKEAGWYLAQLLDHAAYNDKIGDYVTLPFNKAMLPREQVERMAADARKSGNRELYEQCTKALADAPKPPQTMQPGPTSGSYFVPFDTRDARRTEQTPRTAWRSMTEGAKREQLLSELARLERDGR